MDDWIYNIKGGDKVISDKVLELLCRIALAEGLIAKIEAKNTGLSSFSQIEHMFDMQLNLTAKAYDILQNVIIIKDETA